MKKKIIHLLRHAKTDANTLNLIAGTVDRDLNEVGIAETQEFKRWGSYDDGVQFCYTSCQKRAIQTREIAYPDLPFKTDPRLNEIDFGDYEDTNFIMCKDDPFYRAWITQDNRMLITAPGGEEISEARKRVAAALRDSILEMDAKGITEYAVIGHGNLFAELTYLYLHDDRNVKTRIDSTFPNGLGIRVWGFINDEGEMELEYLDDIR